MTTTLSWVFYCKAIKMGQVSMVALIDKGSVVVAVVLVVVILHESLTPAKLVGSGMILAGLSSSLGDSSFRLIRRPAKRTPPNDCSCSTCRRDVEVERLQLI